MNGETAINMLYIFLEMVVLSCVRLFATPWKVALHAPLSMEFSRQAYWNGLPFPSQGIFLTQGSNCKNV